MIVTASQRRSRIVLVICMVLQGDLGVPLHQRLSVLMVSTDDHTVRSLRTGATTEDLESHLTHCCNGLSQQKSWSPTPLTPEAKDHEEVLVVTPH